MDLPRPKLLVHAHKHVCRLGHPLVSNEKPRALTHRLLAEVEHAPVAADQHRIVAEPEQRTGDILMRADQDLTRGRNGLANRRRSASEA